MGPTKSAPLASVLLLTLLGVMAAVLIVPQIDLPDVAFHVDGARLGEGRANRKHEGTKCNTAA